MEIVFSLLLAFVGTVILLVPILFVGKVLSKVIFVVTVLILFAGLFGFFYWFEGWEVIESLL